MGHSIVAKKYWIFSIVMILALALSACSAQTPATQVASSGMDSMTHGSQAATVSYALRTVIVDGKMGFMGVGGEIDGVVNPDLRAQPGDVVEIKLTNADGALHDIAIPELEVASEQIAGNGSETVVTFTAGSAGTYDYYCTIPGHRQAGMQGSLIVGDGASASTSAPTVVRAADDLPAPLNRTAPETVNVDLETVEVEGKLADGSTFVYWTFNGLVPGPFVRVREGDTVVVTLKNAADSQMNHSVDFHAVTGPGGGAVATQTQPGGETTFTFKAINPGIYVYHCATPMVAHHIANGMYGMILVEPEEGLPAVDREFYVMQGEIYTAEDFGTKGANTFSVDRLLDEEPEYFVMNGSVGALTAEHPLQANVGETVRIYYGVGGPNYTSSFHVIGEVFDRVYSEGSLTSEPLTNVQTTLIPAGGAAMVEFKVEVPGRFILVDHSLSRMERGLAGFLMVDGEENHEIYQGEETAGSGH